MDTIVTSTVTAAVVRAIRDGLRVHVGQVLTEERAIEIANSLTHTLLLSFSVEFEEETAPLRLGPNQ